MAASSSRVPETESIKSNLQRVQQELALVRDKAKEEAETLERIRGMIDLRYLNDLLSAIETLERRIKTMERDSEAEPLRRQLKQEQDRLVKLWDAFKTQEDELRAASADRDALLQRLEELETDYRKLGGISKARAKLGYLEKEKEKLATQLAGASQRADEYRAAFDKEQERLAKLFKVYEDAANQVESYGKQEKAWHDWRQKYWSKLPPAARTAGEKLRKRRF